MDWSSTRKLLYIGVLTSIILFFIGIFVYVKFFNKPPSCFDTIQNQDERGIDCGGVCALLCPSESRPLVVQFSRLFKVGPGEYSVFALVENQNQNVFAREVNYVFKVYDKDNILLTELAGKTFAPPGRVFQIFNHSVLTGFRDADKVTLTIEPNVLWERGEFVDPNITVGSIKAEKIDTRFRIQASLSNKEVYALKDMPVYVVVYDDQNNAREASATVVDYVSPNDEAPLSFTWNHNFDFDFAKIDIIPRPLPREWTKQD